MSLIISWLMKFILLRKFSLGVRGQDLVLKMLTVLNQ